MSADQSWQVAIEIINAWFRSVGVDADEHRVDAPDTDDEDDIRTWGLLSGSANVFLTLLQVEQGTALQIHSPILKLPDGAERRAALYEEMLRLNATTLSGCCFGIDDDDEVIVVTDRMTDDMSVEELDELVQSVASYADHYDNALSEKHGAEMIGEDPAEE